MKLGDVININLFDSLSKGSTEEEKGRCSIAFMCLSIPRRVFVFLV